MKSVTYLGWKAIGYQVREGERSSGRNSFGQPIFTRDQVEEVSNGAYWNEMEDELHPGHHDTYWED